MEDVKKDANLEGQEKQDKEFVWRTDIKGFIRATSIVAGGLFASYSLGAHSMKKKIGAGFNALCLIDPTLKDHFLETIKKGQDILKK